MRRHFPCQFLVFRHHQVGRHQHFQVAPAQRFNAVLGRNHLTLLGQANSPIHCTGWLAKNGVVTGTTATPNRPTAAMEQANVHAMLCKHVYQADFCLVQAPAGCHKTPVFVAVGITQHHLLHIAARGHKGPVLGNAKQLVHDGRCGLQVLNGFKQRHHVHRQFAGGHIQQMRFFQQHGQFKQVADRGCFGNNAVLNGGCTQHVVGQLGFAKNRHFTVGAFAVVQ